MQNCVFHSPPLAFLDCKEDLYDIYDVHSGCWKEGLFECACHQRLPDICPSKGNQATRKTTPTAEACIQVKDSL